MTGKATAGAGDAKTGQIELEINIPDVKVHQEHAKIHAQELEKIHAAQAKVHQEQEKIHARMVEIHNADAKVKHENETLHAYVIESAGDPKITPEKKAQIDKARKRIEELRNDLEAKTKALVDAERDLAKLGAVTANFTVKLAKPGEVHVGTPKTVESRVVTRVETAPTTRFRVKTDESSLGKEDHQRLEALEQKINRLLEEVASLKHKGDSK